MGSVRLPLAQAGGASHAGIGGPGVRIAASIWEVAIKARLGKIAADPLALAEAIEASGFAELPVRAVHAAAIAELTLHHHDPFDRLLIAQAVTEPLRLVTADAALPQYSDLVVLV